MKYVTERKPAHHRADKCNDAMEKHFYEPAIMLAIANWMLGQKAEKVSIFPDGMHAK